MDYQRRFRQAAIERGLPPDEIGEFAELLRFEIRTGPRFDGVPVGQFRGLPRLAVGTRWPSTEWAPLPFVTSYDCAALPRVDGLALPADGSLLFFLDHEPAYEASSWSDDEATNIAEEQKHARVVYVPAGAGTVVVEEPEDAEPVGTTEAPFTAERTELFATVVPVLPWSGHEPRVSDSQEYEECALPHKEELRALVAELWPTPGGFSYLTVGGYTRDAGSPEGTPEQRLGVDRREWTQLARFSRQDGLYETSFMIRNDHLAARRFDEALSFTSFTE
ncbi:DUF1963 domain-containing protein [Kitasatospora saccharophila]|uniref:DUF1963 domain-containing protein n=1 Tax=Kitasatospora saccharophila TaxID=407973 RepID=A0ABN2WIL9_9ACTN